MIILLVPTPRRIMGRKKRIIPVRASFGMSFYATSNSKRIKAWNPAPLYTWEFLFCFNHSESLLCQSFPDRLLHCPVVIASNSIHHMGVACKTIQKLNSGYFRCVHSCKVWRLPSRSMVSRRSTAEIYGQWNPPSWTYLVCGRKEIGLCNGNLGRSAILFDVWNSVRVASWRDVIV